MEPGLCEDGGPAVMTSRCFQPSFFSSLAYSRPSRWHRDQNLVFIVKRSGRDNLCEIVAICLFLGKDDVWVEIRKYFRLTLVTSLVYL